MRSIPSRSQSALWALFLCLGCLSCGSMEQSTTIVISVTGLSGDIRTLRVQATLDGATTVQKYAAAAQVGLRLPPGGSGQVALTVSGLADTDCAVATGQAGVLASGEERVDVSVELIALATPMCTLTVNRHGGGIVTSDVGGIQCGVQCSVELPLGTQVALTATSDTGSYLSGWSGACNGTGGCALTLSQSTQVTVTFAPKLCSAGGFCWDNPTPQGNALNAVWGRDPRDIWAVGDGGTILRWNGATWSAQTSGTTSNLYAMWGSDANNIWAVGGVGTILRWDGATWTTQLSGGTRAFRGVWGSDANNIWAVGDNGTIMKWSGTMWVMQTSGTPYFLSSVWGSDTNNVWAAGGGGTIGSSNTLSPSVRLL